MVPIRPQSLAEWELIIWDRYGRKVAPSEQFAPHYHAPKSSQAERTSGAAEIAISYPPIRVNPR
jgi:hypothetical protein